MRGEELDSAIRTDVSAPRGDKGMSTTRKEVTTMRRSVFVLVIALLVWPACSTQQNPSDSSRNIVEAASSGKKEFQEKVESQLRELDQKIDSLRTKTEKQGKGTQKDLNRELTELNQRREAIQREVEKFKNSSEEAWRDMKPGIEAAIRDLETAYNRAASHFN